MHLDAWANADWGSGIPVPESLSRKNWATLPIDEKISLVLGQLKNRMDVEGDTNGDEVLKQCWQISKECSTGKKMLAVRESCLQISSTFKEQQQSKKITLQCEDGEIIIPHFYKRALAKDSDFFNKLFYSDYKEATTKAYAIKTISKAKIERLIQIWAGSPLEDLDEAIDLLQVSNKITLKLPVINDAICAAIKNLSFTDAVVLDDASCLAESISQFIVADEVHDALGAFLVNAYLAAERAGKNQLANEMLASIKQLRVHTLNLDNKHVNDAELEKIIDACPILKSLSLGSSKISDQSAVYIANLKQLTSLNLTLCYQLTGVFLKELANLQQLTSLNLRSCLGIIGADLIEFAKLMQLTSLNLSACSKLTGTVLKELANLQQLTSLDIGESSLTDDDLKELANIKLLTSLNLSDCQRLTGTFLKALVNLDHLTSIDLTACRQLTDDGLKELGNFKQLANLNLRSCKQLKGAFLKDLANLNQLTNLNLRECSNLTETYFKELANLSQLTSLEISYCSQHPDVLVKMLPNLIELTSLGLRGYMLTEAHIKEVAKLNQIGSLDLGGSSQLTEAHLKEFVNFKHLTSLNLSGCYKLTGAQLKELANIKQLTSLNLAMCNMVTEPDIKNLTDVLPNLCIIR